MSDNSSPTMITPALPATFPHTAHFYENEPSLSVAVSDFLQKGATLGQPLVVIATPPHIATFTRELNRRGIDIAMLQAHARAFLYDAEATLSTVMVDGRPNEQLFDATVGSIIERQVAIAGASSIRAFGEMVDVLWLRGERDAAIRLEELWHRLSRRAPFELLCTYSMTNFVAESTVGPHFEDVCAAHTHVSVSPIAPLRDDEPHALAEIARRAQALEAELRVRRELESALRDVLAERTRVETELRRTEEELRDFLENAADGMHWIGSSGRIVWANAAELQMLGYAAEEYIGHHIAEFHVDQNVIADMLSRLGRNETLKNYEAVMRCKDGSIRHVEVDSSVFWRNGEFAHTRCVTRDVTEKKRIDAERERERREGDAIRDRLASIVDSSDDAIVSKTLDGIITSWNGGAERMFGYTAAEACGQHISLIIPADRLGEEDDVLARLRRGERIDHYETERQRKDGRRLAISLTVSPLRDADGRIIGGSKVARDITNQRHAAEKIVEDHERTIRHIEKLRAEAVAANRAKDDFLAVLGHELRNPLAPILTAIELMNLQANGAFEKERSVIERQAKHLVRLVDDMLDVARISRGLIELRKERVELAEVVTRTIDTAEPMLERRQIELRVALPANGLAIEADPARFGQIVMNLIGNAAKFVNPGGRITVSGWRDGASVCLSVADDGVGVDPSMLARIFDMFTQDPQTLERSRGGLGLGLTIVRSLVELHGGSVQALSDGRGMGAEFIIRLPALCEVLTTCS